MKKYFLTAATIMLAITNCFAANYSHELQGWYINPSINYNYLELKDIYTSMNQQQNDTTLNKTSNSVPDFGYTLTVGYGLKNYPIRFALEYSSPQTIRYDSYPLYNTNYPNYYQNFRSNTTTYHIMTNVIFDFPSIEGSFTPYALAGAGYVHNSTTFYDTYLDINKGNNITQEGTSINKGIAWQTGIGANYKFFDGFYANGEIRYLDLGKVSWKNFYAPHDANSYSMQSDNFSSYQASVGLLWTFGGSKNTKANQI